MAGFVEALSKEHLRQWLESNWDWELYAEVSTPDGRIDLAGISPDGDHVGIEIKANVPGYNTDYYDQLWKYLTSGFFDKVYFASHDAEKFNTRLNEKDVSRPRLRTAARHLNGGIRADLYTKQDVLDKMEKELCSDFLNNTDPFWAQNGTKNWPEPRDFVACRLGANTAYDPVELSRGIKMIRRSQAPRDIGIMKIPIGGMSYAEDCYGEWSLTDRQITSPPTALGRKDGKPVKILKSANSLHRSDDPNYPVNRTREPFIKHHVWKEFTGLPEAHIPNTSDSGSEVRPIDVLSFQGGIDPINICSQEDGEVIGIEVKGGSYNEKGLCRQLRGYATSGGLSRLYLAIPESLIKKTQRLLNQEQLGNLVGLATVDKNGVANIVNKAPELSLQYDSYRRSGTVFRIGYDEMSLPTDVSPNSVFEENN